MPKRANVHVETPNFYELFNQENKLSLPMFQRDYTWEEDNLTKFSEDIEKTIKQGTEHFIGQIVLGEFKPDSPITGHILKNFYHIIDGQQRITTATIFLCALRDEAALNKNEEMARSIQKYVTTVSNPPSADYDFIVTLSYSDKEFFKDFVQFELGDGRRKKEKEYAKMFSEGKIRPSNTLIYNAYRFFRERIRAKTCKCTIVQKTNYLERMRDCLLRNFFFIKVRLPDIDEGSQIFETMNAWGERLEAVDLVKNLIFMKLYKQETPTSILESQIIEWNDSVAKLKNADPSRFLRHYWLAKYRDTKEGVTVENLYRAFSDKAESDSTFANQLVTDMRDYSDIYHILYAPNTYSPPDGNPVTKTKVVDALTGLDAMNASRAFPLLMATYKNLPGKFPRMCQFVESFAFRYSLICNQDAKRLEKNINDISVDFEKANKSNKAAINKLFEAKLLELKKQIPPQALFESNFKYKSTWTSKAARYVLSRIEKTKGTGETLLNSRSLTLEHIFPKSPSDECRNEAGKDLERLLSKTNSLGNLSLILGKWNQTMSNKPFSYKRKKYYKKSELKITKALSSLDSWTSKKVDARNKRFMKECENIWNPSSV
jgi:uncharacterized protein with ParB-like and HNH nuclease domain